MNYKDGQSHESYVMRLERKVEELETALEETEHDMHMRIRASYDKTIADSWRAKVAEVERERDEARVEVEMLRGVGCREVKADEPESGPCGVCLRCAEARGAKWALDFIGWSREDDRWFIAERICRGTRNLK